MSQSPTPIRSLPLGILATAILLVCVACSPGGSTPGADDAPQTTSSDSASSPVDDGSTEPAQGDDAQSEEGGSSGASGDALCNDLEGADLNGDSDEDMAAGLTLWRQMVTDAPSDISAAVQKVSEGLDKAAAGDPSVAQTDAWAQAIGQVSTWEIANCKG